MIKDVIIRWGAGFGPLIPAGHKSACRKFHQIGNDKRACVHRTRQLLIANLISSRPCNSFIENSGNREPISPAAIATGLGGTQARLRHSDPRITLGVMVRLSAIRTYGSGEGGEPFGPKWPQICVLA